MVLRLIIKCILAFLLSASKLYGASPAEISILLNKEINLISQEWNNQHNLHVSGSGGSGRNHIDSITLCYHTSKEHTIDTSRKMVVELGQELLQRLNTNRDIKVHLRNYPLSAENLFLSFSFFDEFEKAPAKPPKVASARISYGKVIYAIQEGSDTPSKTIHEETFEEACQLLAKEKKKE